MAKAGIVYAASNDGLWTFSDPGATGRWRKVGQSLAGHVVSAVIAVDPLTLEVRADGRSLRSNDGGQTWAASGNLGPEPIAPPLARTAKGSPHTVSSPPLAGVVAYALLEGKQPTLLGAGAGGTLLFRSLDDGIHWQPAQGPNEPFGNIQCLVPASYHIDVAWAGSDTGMVLRSDDRGETWQIVARALPALLDLAVVRLI